MVEVLERYIKKKTVVEHYLSRELPPESIEYQDSKNHLFFRPYQNDDAKKLELALVSTLPYLYKFTSWPVKNWDYKECLLWIAKKHGEYYLGKEYEWACFDKTTGELLLSIGIMPPTNTNPDCFEIGYWTVFPHANKGFATLATKVIASLAFHCFKVKRLQIGCMKENKASIHVIEKCGFHFEGELRRLFPTPSKELLELGAIDCENDFIYSLLPEDLNKLEWVKPIAKKTTITSLASKKISLTEFLS